MSKVRIGIIGTGYIGNVHGRIYSGDDRAEIGALYDIVPEKAEKTAASIGGRVCESREELFEHCDAVLVCTPNRTHLEIASDAVKHDKHVFCEKPFAIGVEDASKLLFASTAWPVSLSVTLRVESRFFPLAALKADSSTAACVVISGPHIESNTGKRTNPTRIPHETIARKAMKRVWVAERNVGELMLIDESTTLLLLT